MTKFQKIVEHVLDRQAQAEYLLSLAADLGCDTDNDLVITPTPSFGATQVVFRGREKVCWVEYHGQSLIKLKASHNSTTGRGISTDRMIDLSDPDSFAFLERFFHENDKRNRQESCSRDQ